MTTWTVACQAPLSRGFSRQGHWSRLPCLPPRDLPNPGIESRSPTLQGDSLPAEPQGKPKDTGVGSLYLLQHIFPPQELNQGLLHCRWILYQLSYQGSPKNREGNEWQPTLEYSCLENPMDRVVCWATVRGVTKSQTQLSD